MRKPHQKAILQTPSAEYGGLIGGIAELLEAARHTAARNTRAEAIGNAEEAVSFWLQTAKEDGIPIPEPKGRLMVA